MIADKYKKSFPLGRILATPRALDALAESRQHGLAFLGRHARGDWGEVDEGDWRANDEALRNGGRLLSAYKTNRGARIWIITEADRSATTILLPDEY